MPILANMEAEELSFDALAERGQYRAFQRAYGKENQAMLGLILLTVAWSYAAHVYGHASVFSWFMRYLMVGLGIFTTYHLLLYAHSTFERAVGHYRNWEREQNEALRNVRLKEKTKERRKRSRNLTSDEHEDDVDDDSAELAAEAKQRALEEEEQKRHAAKREAEKREAKAQKEAAELEEREARKEVERRKKAQEAATAAVKQTQVKQPTPQQPQPEAKPKSRKKTKDTSKATKTAEQLTEESQQFISQFMHPDQVSEGDVQPSTHPERSPSPSLGPSPPTPEAAGDVPPPMDREELKRAEQLVASAKQEAERAQKQLMMAEEAAKMARAHTKGKLPAPNNQAPSNNKNEKRNSVDKRDSFKGLRATHTGSGYVPPHLRDGYTPKPAKMLSNAYEGGRERSNSNAARKKSYPGPARPLARSPQASGDGKGTPTSSGGVSPGSVQSSPEETQRGRDVKKHEPVFESQNAFAMLLEDDN